MYKFKREHQISFTDFNQPLGIQLNNDNDHDDDGGEQEQNEQPECHNYISFSC